MTDAGYDELARCVAVAESRRESLRLLGRIVGGGALAILFSLGRSADPAAWAASDSEAAPAAGCTMPVRPDGCVKLGGGLHPWYYSGWVCPSRRCPAGLCSGRTLGRPGKCGATKAAILRSVAKGEFKVLAGRLPR